MKKLNAMEEQEVWDAIRIALRDVPPARVQSELADASAETRERLIAFALRYGVDACFCMNGGNLCQECFLAHSISERLTYGPDFGLKDLLLLLFRMNPAFRERIARFMAVGARQTISRTAQYCRMSVEDWGRIFQAVKPTLETLNVRGMHPRIDLQAILKRLQTDEDLRNRAARFIIKRAVGICSCASLGHARYTCFIRGLPLKLISTAGPLGRADVLLVLFHADDSFHKRVAECAAQNGNTTSYCWHSAHECRFTFVGLNKIYLHG